MSVKIRYFSTKQNWLLASIFFLLLPAFLLHLGLIAFYDDEGIRALVALEMQISGNYITPTLFGEFYYNKPPLYNWILAAVFELSGRNDEFITRLTTVFFLMVYAGSVYWFFNKNLNGDSAPTHQSAINNQQFPLLNSQFSILNSLALITCGRILFWDSMLGLIDICFSWVMFLLFMVIYQDGERGRYGRLFGLAYLLGAVGFMLKGLPAIVFLGFALLAYFIWQRKMTLLFSGSHLVGGLIFIAIVGGYYLLYAQHHGLEVIMETLFNESAKRTIVEHGMGETVLHLFTFPFEMWFHFLPWSLLAVFLFRKKAFLLIRENKFITWNILVFLVTVLPYWSSVEVYPRYLFMHVPLVFSAFFYLYLKNKEEGSKLVNAVEMVFFAGSCVAVVVALLPVFLERMQDIPHLWLKSGSLAGGFIFLAFLYWKWKKERIMVFVLVLLMARIGYNWFVLPSRLKIECSTKVRETTIDAVQKLGGEPWYIYGYSLGFQPVTGYYYTRESGKILKQSKNGIEKNTLYLIDPNIPEAKNMKEEARFTIKWKCEERTLRKLE